MEVERFIANFPEEIQEITRVLRKIILDASPELNEEFKWAMPNYSANGLVCYLQAGKKHVNLGFHKGNELQDTNHLLRGTGKTMRHIQVKKIEDVHPELFTAFIKEAVALNKK